MQKFEREQIRELTEADLRDIVGLEIERTPRKIFPVYPADIIGGKDGDVLILYVVQCLGGQYSTVCITVPVSDIGVKCRFWTLPPVPSVMDAMPLKDVPEVQ